MSLIRAAVPVVYVGAPAAVKAPWIADGDTYSSGAVVSSEPAVWAGDVARRTYQWYRNNDPIPGATGATYKIVDADADKTLKLQETAHSSTGASTSVFSNEVQVEPLDLVPLYPENVVAPSVSGALTVGSTLTATDGTLTDLVSVARRWDCNGTPIAGATSKTLKLTSSHVGCYLTYVVTATGSRGTQSSFFLGLGKPVTKAPTPTPTPPAPTPKDEPRLKTFRITGKVKITGTVKIGKKITVRITITRSGYKTATSTSATKIPKK